MIELVCTPNPYQPENVARKIIYSLMTIAKANRKIFLSRLNPSYETFSIIINESRISQKNVQDHIFLQQHFLTQKFKSSIFLVHTVASISHMILQKMEPDFEQLNSVIPNENSNKRVTPYQYSGLGILKNPRGNMGNPHNLRVQKMLISLSPFFIPIYISRSCRTKG